MMEFAQILLACTMLGCATAIAFWNQILYSAGTTLFPWIKENLPELEFYVRHAFAAVDKIITPIRNNIKALQRFTEIKEAWEMLRQYLLKVLVQFERKSSGKWVKRITYWVIRNLKFKQIARVVVEEIVDFDSLPDDVRKEWLKRGNINHDIDVTQLRDRELDLISDEFEEIVNVDPLPDNVEQMLKDSSNSTTQNSSVEIKQKSHIKGWLPNTLPEEWRGELEALRYCWLEEGKPEVWIVIITGFNLLIMFKAYLQIKVENIWLFKRKQG
jgi:hypothetical protein